MRLCTQKYEVHMQRFFYQLGLAIGRRPRAFIIGAILFTVLSTSGFLRFHQINNARITFTDSQSQSTQEGKIFEKFMRQNGSLHMIEVMIQARDNGSLLRDRHRNAVSCLVDELTTIVSVRDELSGKPLTFYNLCDPYCNKNEPLKALLMMYGQNFSRFELTYPNLDLLGQRVFIANNIYQVQIAPNSTNAVIGFRTAILHFFLVHKDVKTLYRWEDAVVEVLHSDRYPLLKLGAASDNIIGQEVRSMGTKTVPLLSISLSCLLIFLVFSSFRKKRRESKPIEAILGGMIPVLAGVTTIGLVSATGLAFQSIVVSTLFMLLAIGIDDVFIMLAAWHRTDRNKAIETRIAETVQISGCSMTVTSITNIISFGNGVLSTTPVLQTFAIYSTVASVVCYFYQLILFPAILTLTAHKEYEKSDSDGCMTACLPEEMETVSTLGKARDRGFRWLAGAVETWWMRLLTVVFLGIFWWLSVYGVKHVETDLSVQKLALPESPIVSFKKTYDEALKDMQTYAVVVQRPGDLRNETHLQRARDLILAYERASYAAGPDSTFSWLRAYEEFLQFYEEDQDEVHFTYTDLPAFLRSEESYFYKATLRLNETACGMNQPQCIQQYMFTTGFTTLVKFAEMHPLVAEWRKIAVNYSEFDVIAYSERSNFADQSVSLEPVIWQTLMSEVICMGISFLIFIPDMISIIAALFALLSVNLGVFGFLSLWNVGVDPFSMASLLMSIGFSVDICAHISYHYYEVKASSPRAKMEDALVNVGWPTMQGSLATLFSMLPILIKPSYLGLVFLKTVFLVTSFGLLHGLVILPVLLSLLTQMTRKSKVLPSEKSLSESTTSSMNNVLPHRISIKSFQASK